MLFIAVFSIYGPQKPHAKNVMQSRLPCECIHTYIYHVHTHEGTYVRVCIYAIHIYGLAY